MKQFNLQIYIEQIQFTYFNNSIDHAIFLIIAYYNDYDNTFNFNMIFPQKLTRGFRKYII